MPIDIRRRGCSGAFPAILCFPGRETVKTEREMINTMEKARGSIRLPYVEGGAPGALAAFAGLEAVESLVMCLLYLLVLFTGGSLVNIVTVGLSIAGMVLAFRLWTGLRKLHQGIYSATDTAVQAISGRRALLWIGYAIVLAQMLIAMISSNVIVGTGILGFLIAALIGFLILLPLNFYYKSASEVLGHVGYEGACGKPARPEKLGSFSVWCIIFGALLLFISLLYMFGPYIAEVFDNERLFRLLRNAGIYDSFARYQNLVMLILYISAARFLVGNICFRGFLRSHRAAEGENLRPTGLENSYGICVMGSVLFGWVFLTSLGNWIEIRRVLREVSQSLPEEVRLLNSYSTNYQLFMFIGAFLLAVALMLRKRRTIPGLLGSAAMIAGSVFGSMHYSARMANPRITEAMKESFSMFAAAHYLLIAFFAITIIALLVRLSRRVPKAVPFLLMAIAVAYGVLNIVGSWPSSEKSGFRPEDILTVISNLIFYGGVMICALSGMAWLVKTPTSTDSLFTAETDSAIPASPESADRPDEIP